MVGSVANDGATNIGAADSMDGTIIRLQRQEQKEKEAKAQQSKAAEAQIMASEGGYMKPAPEFKPSSETASGLMGLMSLVAVSGAMLGMKGRTSGLMAINAASGMMEGYNKGRNELFEQQKQQFEQHMKSWEQNRTMLKEAFDRALKIAPTNLTLAQETLNRDLVALGAQPLAAINKRSGPIAAAVAHSQFDSNFEKQAKPLRENAKKLGINISSTADLLSEAQAEQAEAKAKIAAEDAAIKRRKEEAETKLQELKVESGGLTPDETRKLQADKNWAASIKAQYDKTGEPPVLKTFDEQRIYSSIYKDLPFKTEEPKPDKVAGQRIYINDYLGESSKNLSQEEVPHVASFINAADQATELAELIRQTPRAAGVMGKTIAFFDKFIPTRYQVSDFVEPSILASQASDPSLYEGIPQNEISRIQLIQKKVLDLINSRAISQSGGSRMTIAEFNAQRKVLDAANLPAQTAYDVYRGLARGDLEELRKYGIKPDKIENIWAKVQKPQTLIQENTFPNDKAANAILKQRGYKKGDRVQIISGGENITWEVE